MAEHVDVDYDEIDADDQLMSLEVDDDLIIATSRCPTCHAPTTQSAVRGPIGLAVRQASGDAVDEASPKSLTFECDCRVGEHKGRSTDSGAKGCGTMWLGVA